MKCGIVATTPINSILTSIIKILLLIILTSTLSKQSMAQVKEVVNGTTGTPMGGFGAGAVKFNAHTGSFSLMTRPPADAYDFKPIRSARFRLFVNRNQKTTFIDTLKARRINGRPDDDAIWPVHRVNFGTFEGVEVQLTGFSPFDNVTYDNMSLPYAFFDFTVKNKGTSSVTTAVALQWSVVDEVFKYVQGRGIVSKSIAVFCVPVKNGPSISAGDGTSTSLNKTGRCDNVVSSGSAEVAGSVLLKPNESKSVRFVLAWYEYSDPQLAYYFNLFHDVQSVANHGISRFDVLKANASNLVNRFQASSLPGWLKNQTINTLANLSTNSMYKKDGRVAFSEGQWTCFGTMDQMWHARQIIAQLLPFFAWQELRYWARTQMQNGQIHHDFNDMNTGTQRERRSELVSWDDTEHKDYRDIQKWVDLNCALIVSTYETYQLTANKKEFEFLWPYLKKAGQRILDQVKLYGNKQYLFTFDSSENSYDAGGNPNPFNASMSAVAYKIMVKLATEQNDTELALKYQNAYETGVRSYNDRYLKTEDFFKGNHCESFFAGQWLALHLKLGEIWDKSNTDLVLDKLDNFYHPYYWGLGNEKGSYDEWTPYILTHYGGLLLNTGRAAEWETMQKDAYNRQYFDRDKVFDHPLNILPKVKDPNWVATNRSSDKQYISLPAIWRNYNDLAGYFLDARTRELWIKPLLPPSVKHQMSNVLVISPEGLGTISCQEEGKFFQNKDILVKPDNPTQVSTLYFADNFGERAGVFINGKKMPFERRGTGYAKELAVKWNGTIGREGLHVVIQGDPGLAPPNLPKPPPPVKEIAEKKKISAYDNIDAVTASKMAGVQVSKSNTGTSFISSCNNFDYIHFSNIDFGKDGASELQVKVASPIEGGVVEIVLDNVAGEVVGSCAVPATGGFDIYKTLKFPISRTRDVHDVILKFSGESSGDLFNIESLKFMPNQK